MKMTLELRFLRILLDLRGISDHELARSTGFALGTVRNVLSGCGEYPEVKRAIETALDSTIWTKPAVPKSTQKKIMNTSSFVPPLPTRFEPLGLQFADIRERQQKLAEEIAVNDGDLAQADAERVKLEQSGPPTDDTVRRLSDLTVRCQLYRNHASTLQTRMAAVTSDARQLTRTFARELRKLGAEYGAMVRKEFLASVCKMVVEPENQVAQALQWLRPPSQIAAEMLDREAAAFESETRQTPFDAWNALVELLYEFAELEKPTLTAFSQLTIEPAK